MEDVIAPPHSLDNFDMKADLNALYGDSSDIHQHNFKDVQKDFHLRGRFASSHPTPCLQGLFLTPIGQ